MDFLNSFIQIVTSSIDGIIVFIVLISGFMQERLFCKVIINKKDAKYNGTIRTLIVSLIISAIWIMLTKHDPAAPRPWAKYFLSYVTATSLYDLLIHPFTKKIKAAVGDDTPDAPVVDINSKPADKTS